MQRSGGSTTLLQFGGVLGAEVPVEVGGVVTVEDVVLKVVVVVDDDGVVVVLVVSSHVSHSTKHRRRIAEPNRGSEQIVRC